MAYPDVRFVVAPAVGATTRFNFNDGVVAWPEHDGYSLGEPTVEGDPAGVGVGYGPRTITFALRVDGTKAVAQASMAALARELIRPTNWLLFQLSATSYPVWFKTYRSQFGALTLDNVYSETATDSWQINVSLVADPWAYGARVTQASVTVTNDPTGNIGSGNALCLSGGVTVLGDAPTPLEVKMDPSNTATSLGFRYMLHMHSGQTARYPWFVDLPGAFTLGTDVTSVADATAAGGTVARTTFAINNALGTLRVYGAMPSPPPPGRYKVLLRASRTDTVSSFTVSLGQGGSYFPAGTFYPGPVTTFDYGISSATGHTAWLDLGMHTFPRGIHPQDSSFVGTVATPEIALFATRLSGTGSLNMDGLLFVPVEMPDTTLASLLYDWMQTNLATGTGYLMFNGAGERTYLVNAVGEIYPTFHSAEGGYPYAVPGDQNVLTVLHQANGTNPYRLTTLATTALNASDDKTWSAAITVSYTPRYLWLA